jgi:hypothetical protein
MAGKKKDPNKTYSPKWGGRRVPGEKMVKDFQMAHWQVRALERMGDGDVQRGFNLVMEKYRHI